MRALTANEIARTAFKAIPQDQWKSEYGYKHPAKDKNTMCPYCKNEVADIEPFKRLVF